MYCEACLMVLTTTRCPGVLSYMGYMGMCGIGIAVLISGYGF